VTQCVADAREVGLDKAHSRTLAHTVHELVHRGRLEPFREDQHIEADGPCRPDQVLGRPEVRRDHHRAAPRLARLIPALEALEMFDLVEGLVRRQMRAPGEVCVVASRGARTASRRAIASTHVVDEARDVRHVVARCGAH
jgi:hypothetical protein